MCGPGLPGHPPKVVVPRYPPRGVLLDCSRPGFGSCRGVVSPLTGCSPHKFPPSQERTRGFASWAVGSSQYQTATFSREGNMSY